MPHLIEFYDRETSTIVPRMQDGSTPIFLYRIMSRAEYDQGASARVFRSRDGRLHAAPVPLLRFCEPGHGNVLVRISFNQSDGWRAKQTLDGVVAIADQIPASNIHLVAEGTRAQIEARMSKMRIEAKTYQLGNLALSPLNEPRGQKMPDGRKLYRFAVQKEGKEVATFGLIFADDPAAAYFSIDGDGANTLGTSGMRNLFRLIRSRFPRLKKLSGFRATGARRAAGKTGDIEMKITKAAVEAKTALNLKINPKGRETGRNFSDGKYVLYQFEIILDGSEIGELSIKFIGGDKDSAKVNIFGNAKGRLGTSGMRALFALMKKRFPKLEHIYGERISGARAKSGKTNKMAHFTIADFVKSAREATASVDSISQRLSGFFSVMSKPNDDLQRVQQGRALWAQFVRQFQRVMKNRQYFKDVVDKEFFQDAGTGISFQRIRSNPFTPPYRHMGEYAFFISMEKLLNSRDHKWAGLQIVLNFVPTATMHGSGVFYAQGIWGSPTIVVNTHFQHDRNQDRFDRDEVRKFADTFDRQASLAKVFTHEFSHYLDWLVSNEKTPPQKDENGRILKWGGDKSKYVSPDDLHDKDGKPFNQQQLNERYRLYVNNHREINSRYMEWIDGIIISFERLISVKKDGVKTRFPNFHAFWEYYWKEPGYAPDNLRRHADPKTTRRLARRLSKFYDYVTESGDRPAPQDLKKFAARQLDDDPKFVERDTSFDTLAQVTVQRAAYPFIADFSGIAEASIHDAFGPSVGVGTRPDEFTRERELEHNLWGDKPKAPKPADDHAAKVTKRDDPGTTNGEPEDEDNEGPADEAADEGTDEASAKGKSKSKAPPAKNKGRPRPRMQLRANYRRK